MALGDGPDVFVLTGSEHHDWDTVSFGDRPEPVPSAVVEAEAGGRRENQAETAHRRTFEDPGQLPLAPVVAQVDPRHGPESVGVAGRLLDGVAITKTRKVRWEHHGSLDTCAVHQFEQL
jgi:hypothetical protein